MAKTTYIWTITFEENDELATQETNHFTKVTDVKKFRHLLVCAGYNEDSTDLTNQTWIKTDTDGNTKTFDIVRHYANPMSLKRNI